MENPYRWPAELEREWLESLQNVEINRYPDPAAIELTNRLRSTMNIPADAGVVLGNGSDELIQMILMAIAESGRTVMAPEPSFVMYKMIATYVGMKFSAVPLKESDFELDLDKILTTIVEQQPAIIFLAYPNNPTGNLWKRADIEQILEVAEGFVVVDEAYHVFANDSFMGDIYKYENLLVMRTLSKMGLAGLRLGLLAGGRKWITEIDKVRLPYNINTLTQHTASFILNHAAVLEKQAAELRSNREDLLAQLQQLADSSPLIQQVYPSQANFILFRVDSGWADKIFEGLKLRGVLIKNLNPASGALSESLRVTVSTKEENAQFLIALKRCLEDE
jgi:histidinol-phosphate aminotransferase